MSDSTDFLLRDARRKLLETGTRNRLIHVNRNNRGANCLNIINERSDDIFAILRTARKKMRFRATGDEDQTDQDRDTPNLSLSAGQEETDSARHNDRFLETPLGPDGLQKRLLRLARDAKTAEEEQGINILYLALGFLTWFEDTASDVQREAPLVLLPVDLIRNDRTSTYDIRCRDDDIATNLPLQERFSQDFGMRLPDINEEDGWSPSGYFSTVSEAISQHNRWRIEQDAMQLGFFSFAKLLMLHDLEPESWPPGALLNNNLVTGLLSTGFEPDSPLFGPDDRLDRRLDPIDIIHVVDADASQTKVIDEVRRGTNLVVQGPPGTGKSQTITNIIATAVHDGKSVLFMAEKMAALSVVHERLKREALNDVCLELHSRKANKKALAQELAQTLKAAQRPPPAPVAPEDLRQARDDLNRIEEALHSHLSGVDYSPFDAVAEIVHYIGSNTPAPSLEITDLERFGSNDRRRIEDNIVRLIEALDAYGSYDKHPFLGARELDLQPTDRQRLSLELNDAVEALDSFSAHLTASLQPLGIPPPETFEQAHGTYRVLRTLARAPEGSNSYIRLLFPKATDTHIADILRAGAQWEETHAALDHWFVEDAWNTSAARLRGPIARGKASFFARLGGAYRKASVDLATLLRGDLPKSASERLALVDRLSSAQLDHRLLADNQDFLQSILGERWRGRQTNFTEALRAVEWLRAIRDENVITTPEALLSALDAQTDHQVDLQTLAAELAHWTLRTEEAITKPLDRLSYDLESVGFQEGIRTVPIRYLSCRIAAMRDRPERYEEWVQTNRIRNRLIGDGLDAVVQSIRVGTEAAALQREFRYACAEARWRYALSQRPQLAQVATLNRHDMVDRFRELERKRMTDVQSLILSRHLEQVPRGSDGEMRVIRGEIARKRGHKPIRWVMRHAGGMVQRIKPVFLMSPISIAQFLPAGSLDFDLLVIDEASQVLPADALGAIARTRQIVVVGDQKQLPPTSFFDRLTDSTLDPEEEDGGVTALGAKATEMESILTLCEARGLRQRMLEWHYRSRDPSLMRVSNTEFYENNLILSPSPLEEGDNYGLVFRLVRGAYTSRSRGGGRTRTNKIEAQEIVTAVARYARDWPDRSLGVATFSKAQSDMVTELLEYERRKDGLLDYFLREGKAEDVFVKNIENVQGDERDVILISVGYGPHEPGGRLSSMNFGPVNNEGGERRLNVLFSRARMRCEVFASFDPEDIDLARTSSEGPRILKRFLMFAKSRQIEEHVPVGVAADSPFEQDVARVIRGLGYEVDPQVGSAGFRIDLGVRHSERLGRYILAVECDGATYHSALWARERDRLRQEVLEGLGWRFHRIWSTDWFHRPSQETERLRRALEEARIAAHEGVTVRGANNSGENPSSGDVDSLEDAVTVDSDEIPTISVPKYRKAQLSVDTGMEPQNAPLDERAQLVIRIVEVEGPIHFDEVARRLASAFGKRRTGSRIAHATREALHAAEQITQKPIRVEGDFWFTESQRETPPVRDRSEETGTLVKPTLLPPLEIRAAAKLIEKEGGSMEMNEMVRAVARLLGFRRTGSEVQETIENCISAPRQ